MSPSILRREAATLQLVLCAVLLLGGCDFSLTIDLGTIRVRVTATGSNLDPDGYTVRVTGNGENQNQMVATNGEVLFAVPSGSYTVTLGEVASNCTVDLNPQSTVVTSGNTSVLTFNTVCS